MDTLGGIEAPQSPKNVFGFEISSEKVHMIEEGDLKKLARGRLKNVVQSSSPGNNEYTPRPRLFVSGHVLICFEIGNCSICGNACCMSSPCLISPQDIGPLFAMQLVPF